VTATEKSLLGIEIARGSGIETERGKGNEIRATIVIRTENATIGTAAFCVINTIDLVPLSSIGGLVSLVLGAEYQWRMGLSA
jgi:hypothetical protein